MLWLLIFNGFGGSPLRPCRVVKEKQYVSTFAYQVYALGMLLYISIFV
jgi:hypothetical protein